jgi:hypothetical protein
MSSAADAAAASDEKASGSRLANPEAQRMITRRTLLLYNFGIAGLLVFIGLLSMVGADASQIKRLNDLPNFNAEARAFITDETDIERLRSRSVFYFEVARDLKRARTDDSSRVFKDASTLAFFVAILFALSGGMLILYGQVRKKAGLVE